MPDENEAVRDTLWKMYQEHCVQGRHHETQRSTVVSAIAAISAAIIGIVTFDNSIAAPTDVPPVLLLIALGAFGAGFSLKHYERFELHMKRARKYRDALDEKLLGKPIKRLKGEADDEQRKAYPHMYHWRLHYWWVSLNLAIALVGVALLVIALLFPLPPPPTT